MHSVPRPPLAAGSGRAADCDQAAPSAEAEQQEVARGEIAAGLCAPVAHVSPKYLYDTLGSRLFEAICELPEYYPTRTERAIFDAHLPAIAASTGLGATLIDLGAGNCAKAARLFGQLQPAQYVAVDISADFLGAALERLQPHFPAIEMRGLGLDFSRELRLPDTVQRARRLFFYPGSSIGNFSPIEAKAFLRRLRAACGHDGGLLIGIDLLKDSATLECAYDDALGLTAAFNLNLLRHLNHVLGADFDVRQWRHRSFFNAELNRVEMHLEARCALTVRWPGGCRQFAAGESIHTENSYKYRTAAFLSMLKLAGFGQARVWQDEADWFAVIHARAI